jgi:hypothetical protein
MGLSGGILLLQNRWGLGGLRTNKSPWLCVFAPNLTSAKCIFKKRALVYDNGQALVCLNRYCYASKLNHIIQMCYPSDLVGELGGLASFDSVYMHFAELAGDCELDEDETGFALRRFRLPGRHKGGQGRARAGWLRCAAFIGGAMQAVPRWADTMSDRGEVKRLGFLPALAATVGFTPGVFQDRIGMLSPFGLTASRNYRSRRSVMRGANNSACHALTPRGCSAGSFCATVYCSLRAVVAANDPFSSTSGGQSLPAQRSTVAGGPHNTVPSKRQ